MCGVVMTPDNGWLKKYLENLEKEVGEVKADVKLLLEDKWKRQGMTIVISVIVSLVTTALAIWLRA